jgi:hypothetical protein
MSWAITCECGCRLTEETDAALTDAARRHVAAEHPAVAPPSAADVLAMAEQVDSGAPELVK